VNSRVMRSDLGATLTAAIVSVAGWFAISFSGLLLHTELNVYMPFISFLVWLAVPLLAMLTLRRLVPQYKRSWFL
jgi:hypothetical protein